MKSDNKKDICETSLILFCANYKKERLEKVRRKNKTKNCLKCLTRTISKKTSSSTPIINEKQQAKTEEIKNYNDLFFNTLSPISLRHNTLERIKRENLVRKNLLEKSLHAVIAEAKRELKEVNKVNIENDYVTMNANNNNDTKYKKFDSVEDYVEDYVEDEVYEDIFFQQKHFENTYEPVNFNIYEPIESL